MDADAESDRFSRLSSSELSGNPSRCREPIDSALRHASRIKPRQAQAQEGIRRPHRRTPSALDRGSAHVSERSSAPLRPLRKATTSRPETDDSSSFDDTMLDEVLREDTSLDSTGSRVSGFTNNNSKDSLLQIFRKDLEDIRVKVSCSICIKLLFEPYTLACGHTFCYSCLCQWFQSNSLNKTCPECRTSVQEQPAPAYLVKDLVQIFIGKTELMGPGETSADNQRVLKEESEQVERDRANKNPKSGGLFRGCFRTKSGLQVIRDVEDGVHRCPQCNWELEDGSCLQCGWTFDDDGRLIAGRAFDSDFSDMDGMDDMDDLDGGMDLSLEELDGDLDAELEDLEDEEGDYLQRMDPFLAYTANANGRRLAGMQPMLRRGSRNDVLDDRAQEVRAHHAISSEEESDDDGTYGSLSDFIDDDEAVAQPSSAQTRSGSRTESSTDDEDTTPVRQSFRLRQSESSANGASPPILGNEDDFDEGGSVSNGRRARAAQDVPAPRRPSHRRAVVIDSESDHEDELHTLDRRLQDDVLQRSGWSPLHRDTPEEVSEPELDEDGPSHDVTATADPSVGHSGRTAAPSGRRTARRDADPRTRARSNQPPGRHYQRGRRSVTTILSDSDDDRLTGDRGGGDASPISIDDDGDVEMNEGAARGNGHGATGSRAKASTGRSGNTTRGAVPRETIELNSDSSSGGSIRPPPRRRPQWDQQAEYDPRTRLLPDRQHRNLGAFRRSHTVAGLDPREQADTESTQTSSTLLSRTSASSLRRSTAPRRHGSPSSSSRPRPTSFGFTRMSASSDSTHHMHSDTYADFLARRNLPDPAVKEHHGNAQSLPSPRGRGAYKS